MTRAATLLRPVFNGLGAALFVFFAWLQHEDDNPDIYVDPSLPDVILWIALYGLVSSLFLSAILGRFPRWIFLLVAALSLFHLATTLPGILDNLRSGGLEMAGKSMSPDRAEVELSREFFGALIALGATALIWIQRPSVPPASPPID